MSLTQNLEAFSPASINFPRHNNNSHTFFLQHARTKGGRYCKDRLQLSRPVGPNKSGLQLPHLQYAPIEDPPGESRSIDATFLPQDRLCDTSKRSVPLQSNPRATDPLESSPRSGNAPCCQAGAIVSQEMNDRQRSGTDRRAPPLTEDDSQTTTQRFPTATL